MQIFGGVLIVLGCFGVVGSLAAGVNGAAGWGAVLWSSLGVVFWGSVTAYLGAMGARLARVERLVVQRLPQTEKGPPEKRAPEKARWKGRPGPSAM